ncbi:protein CREG1-like [Atheta coriaria]|uniref:protein CREG1-like n=1 Tax=Dalotia coriaria TaxID=877792 RepID=UPI0031F357FF
MAKFVAFAAILVALAVANAVPIKQESAAQKARYAMSKTSWVSIATISTTEGIQDYPMVNVKSTADAGTGIPYLFFSDLDLSVIDINSNPKASILATLADGDCVEGSLDPQDPRCPRLILTGTVVKVEDSQEEKLARSALYANHPDMEMWAGVHDFYISKMNIERVTYLGNFGGADIIDPSEYLATKL